MWYCLCLRNPFIWACGMEGQRLLLVYVDCPQPTKGCVPKILFCLPTLKGKTQPCRDNVLNAGLVSRPNHKAHITYKVIKEHLWPYVLALSVHSGVCGWGCENVGIDTGKSPQGGWRSERPELPHLRAGLGFRAVAGCSEAGAETQKTGR